MKKKLVKTAKQQFEERLRQLHTIVEQVIDKDMHFYGCMNAYFDFYVLYSDADKEFYECRYERQLEDVIQSEEFLMAMVRRFDQGSREIRPLFEWYASAGHEINEAAPLDLRDVANIGIEKEFITFKDMEIEVEVEEEPYHNERTQAYKEIEDKGMKLEYEHDNCKYYSSEANGIFEIVCIWTECVPNKYSFGMSRAELYKNIDFQQDLLRYFASDRTPEEAVSLALWMHDQSKPAPFDVYDIITAIDVKRLKVTVAEYKAQPIKQDFKDEMNALREKMMAHIVELHDQGMSINSESFLKNATSVTWASGSYYDCANIREVYLRERVDNGFEFSYECKHDAQGDSSDCGLHELSVETLACIIEALQ